MKYRFLPLVALLGYSCSPKTVDLIVRNARVYTVDADFSKREAFAIQN